MFVPSALLVSAWLAASPTPAPKVHALEFLPVRDGVITGTAAAAWLVSEVPLKRTLAPETCRWCEPNGLDSFVRGARWSGQENTADTLSNVAGFGLVPLTVIGLDSWLAVDNQVARAIPEDLVIILESSMLALVVNQGVKFAVGRERPFVHALPPEQKPLTAQPSDNNLSFFSGHTTFAFSMVVAAGVVAEERGYQGRALIWGVGVPLAALTAYLRIAADRHYLTDVLVGMAVGSGLGIGVPLLLHPRKGTFGAEAISRFRLRLLPTADGAALTGVF